ncbi:cyclase family protein [Campylobacter sp. RM16187]|uniref:cyclase family protein n=1 Tax=Campylobacter sp. RM16187 TaxID=1660063 RepID=UPI0021B555F9|nr:cyclase family protein [Campylobacter sp. RM16187]QKG28321.1 cyclase family protein [Campylobacter sp. RM16187]
MKIIDLSPVLSSKMQIYPGDAPLLIEQNLDGGFCTGNLSMSLHVGSHTDFAMHCGMNTAASEEISLSYFVGEAVCIGVKANLNEAIKFQIQPHPKNAQILLLNVHCEFKDEQDFFINSPFLDEDFLNLAQQNGFKTIATNLSTIDAHGSNLRHKEAFERGVQIIECLVNLKPLEDKTFFFSAAPLKIANADAAPLRAYAILQS